MVDTSFSLHAAIIRVRIRAISMQIYEIWEERAQHKWKISRYWSNINDIIA